MGTWDTEETHTHTHTHTHTQQPCEDRGRNWSDAATREGMPRIAGNHQKLGKNTEEFFPRAF